METTNKVTPTNAKGSAADRLLDRVMPDDYLREWTQHVAAEKKSVEPGTKSVVIFRIGVEWLALPTLVFQQIAEECALHKMPGRGREILSGLVNIHGELVLCVSLEKVLGLGAEVEENKRTGRTIYKRLMVCNRNGDRLAFPVQEIQGLLFIILAICENFPARCPNRRRNTRSASCHGRAEQWAVWTMNYYSTH